MIDVVFKNLHYLNEVIVQLQPYIIMIYDHVELKSLKHEFLSLKSHLVRDGDRLYNS